MKYKCLQIRPSLLRKGKWDVSVTQDGMDRVKGKTCTPRSMGFFHYWETIPDEKAFDQLKQLLITQHEKEIQRLMKSLRSLRALELNSPRGSRGR